MQIHYGRSICLLFAGISLLLVSFQGYTQEIKLDRATVGRDDLEYSAMVKCGKRILLIPQYPDKFPVYAVDTNALLHVIRQWKTESLGPANTKEIEVTGLKEVIVKNNMSHWRGIEAAACTGEEIFFTVETGGSNSDCYVIKGRLAQDRIVMDANYLVTLPKLQRAQSHCAARIRNGGYESLVSWKDKLMAVFEYNCYPNHSLGYIIDPGGRSQPQEMTVTPLSFRMTDMTIDEKGKMYGINYYYGGDYDYIDPSCNRCKVDPRVMKKEKLEQLKDTSLCYSRIIGADMEGDKLVWYQGRDICKGCHSNWEGLVTLKGYFLVINDTNGYRQGRAEFIHTRLLAIPK